MMNFKNLFKKKRSNIKAYLTNESGVNMGCQSLVNDENIEITSISVTRVFMDVHRGSVDKYMVAVSYNYYK